MLKLWYLDETMMITKLAFHHDAPTKPLITTENYTSRGEGGGVRRTKLSNLTKSSLPPWLSALSSSHCRGMQPHLGDTA